jgi:hypothetical protein
MWSYYGHFQFSQISVTIELSQELSLRISRHYKDLENWYVVINWNLVYLDLRNIIRLQL